MTKKEAGSKLKETLRTCTDAQARDVQTLLEIGAGLLSLREHGGAVVFSGPADLPNERREAYINLVDAVYNCEPESGAEEWTPVHSGGWEYVIATLVIERDWGKISECAEDLRRQAAERETL